MEKKKLTSKKSLAAATLAKPAAETAAKPVAVDVEEKAFKQIRQMDNLKKVQRITIDMPLYLYEQIKDEVDKKGYSITGFVVALTRKYFEGQQ